MPHLTMAGQETFGVGNLNHLEGNTDCYDKENFMVVQLR